MKPVLHTRPVTPHDLPSPFPRHGAPDRRPRIAIYAAYPHTANNLPPNTYRRIIVQVFTELYAAKHFAQLFLTDPTSNITLPHTLLDDNRIHIPSTDVLLYTKPIRSSPLTINQILAHTFSPAQLQFRLPNSVARQPFILTRPFTTTLTTLPDAPQPIAPIEQTHARTRTKREPRQTLKDSGRVHVSVIAQQLGITPREARQALRDSKTRKPEGGWWLPPAEIQHYTDLIKKHLKKRP